MTVILDEAAAAAVLAEASSMRAAYDRENRQHPRTPYDHGGIDLVTLRIIERQVQGAVVAVRRHRGEIHLLVRHGALTDDWYDSHVDTKVVIGDFTQQAGAQLADRICHALPERYNNGVPSSLRVHMMTPQVCQQVHGTVHHVAGKYL